MLKRLALVVAVAGGAALFGAPRAAQADHYHHGRYHGGYGYGGYDCYGGYGHGGGYGYGYAPRSYSYGAFYGGPVVRRYPYGHWGYPRQGHVGIYGPRFGISYWR